jgi:O-antigen/teichoic acid export membrane protein
MQGGLEESEALGATLRDATTTGVRVVALRLASYAVGLVASVLIARALGPHGRGLYVYPLAILGVAMALGHLGIEQANVYLASRGVDLPILWANGLAVSVIVGPLAWAVVAGLYYGIGASGFGGVPFVWLAVALGQIPILLQALYWTSVLQLNGRLTTAMRASLAGVALHAALTVLLFATGTLSPFRVLLLAWVANGSAWVLLLLAGSRAGIARLHPDTAQLKKAVLFGLKAHGGLIFVFLLLRVDQLMVKSFLGFTSLGLYALATMLAELLWLLTDPMAAALLPHQVRAGERDARQLGYATARLNLAMALVMGTVAWIAAPLAIRVVYGSAFVGAASAFRLLLPGSVLLSAQRPLGAIVLKDGRPWLGTLFGGGALILNVSLNLALLPHLGINGASIASSICYAGIAAAYVLATRRRGVVGWRDLVPRPSDLRLLFGRSGIRNA